MFPAPSTAMSPGPPSCALAAGPSSPEYPRVPVPATVVIMPVRAATFRMRTLKSQKYRLPAPSSATLDGKLRSALVAGPLSPPYPPVDTLLGPDPATVAIVYDGLF